MENLNELIVPALCTRYDKLECEAQVLHSLMPSKPLKSGMLPDNGDGAVPFGWYHGVHEMLRTGSLSHQRKIRANVRPGDLPRSVLYLKKQYTNFFSAKSYRKRMALLKRFRNKWLRQNRMWF